MEPRIEAANCSSARIQVIIHPSIPPLTHLSSLRPSPLSLIYHPSVHPPSPSSIIHPPTLPHLNHLSTHPSSVSPFINYLNHPPIHPLSHPSIHPSIHPPMACTYSPSSSLLRNQTSPDTLQISPRLSMATSVNLSRVPEATPVQPQVEDTGQYQSQWPPRSRCPSNPSAERTWAPAGPAGTTSSAGLPRTSKVGRDAAIVGHPLVVGGGRRRSACRDGIKRGRDGWKSDTG